MQCMILPVQKKRKSAAYDGWMCVVSCSELQNEVWWISGEAGRVWFRNPILFNGSKNALKSVAWKGWTKSKKKISVCHSWGFFHICVGWVGLRCHMMFAGSVMKWDWAKRLWFQNWFIFILGQNNDKKRENECVSSKAVDKYPDSVRVEAG